MSVRLFLEGGSMNGVDSSVTRSCWHKDSREEILLFQVGREMSFKVQ